MIGPTSSLLRPEYMTNPSPDTESALEADPAFDAEPPPDAEPLPDADPPSEADPPLDSSCPHPTATNTAMTDSRVTEVKRIRRSNREPIYSSPVLISTFSNSTVIGSVKTLPALSSVSWRLNSGGFNAALKV